MSNQKPIRAVAALLFAAGLVATIPARAADVVASSGWSRVTPPGATQAVGYLALTNQGAEERKLLRITSPACEMIMVYRSSIDAEGRARMWPVASVALQPGETVKFEPDGLHLMLQGIAMPFKAGEKVPVVMQFDDRAAPVTIQLEVRPLVPVVSPAVDQAHRH